MLTTWYGEDLVFTVRNNEILPDVATLVGDLHGEDLVFTVRSREISPDVATLVDYLEQN